LERHFWGGLPTLWWKWKMDKTLARNTWDWLRDC